MGSQASLWGGACTPLRKRNLGLIDIEDIRKERNKETDEPKNRKPKTKVNKTISERVIGRAIKKLGTEDEPIDEVIRGESNLWKVPFKGLHLKCKKGRPKVNWIINTAKEVWDREKL